MKAEKDFKEGSTVIFSNALRTYHFTGIVDYSEGAEASGRIRVRQVLYETSDLGNIVYVPINQIFDALP